MGQGCYQEYYLSKHSICSRRGFHWLGIVQNLCLSVVKDGQLWRNPVLVICPASIEQNPDEKEAAAKLGNVSHTSEP